MNDDFKIENGVLIGYHGNASEVTIPEDVTEIAEGAFCRCKHLTGITIPGSVTRIGKSAFSRCENLTHITIPESVTEIGDWAFSGCKHLTGIMIPEGVTRIGEWTFSWCKRLTSITIPEGIISTGEGVFLACSSLTSVTLPDGTVSIGAGVFYGCENLTRITIPESVTSIGNCAFYRCRSLTSLTIPDRVTFIDKEAFSGCENLKIRYQQYTFTSISEMNPEKLLKIMKKDFSVEMALSEKAPLIFQMYRATPEDEEILAYIRENFIEMFKILIDRQDQETANQIIASGKFLNEKNIDDLISYAIEKKSHEIQIMLMDYEVKHFDFDDTAEDIPKKFEL